ncbi:MFS transporter [Geobacter sp. FeAm09]|uniref:MFS transporter n=1 Tax=Geobacter sp. FeAm09 TaxID=2597769 RepID=UPI0011ED83A1|nr:MFS transporter [Geobacter sp. FeAm09]QEM67703.1 MFS transporter [Geobacter sp. FeAm09]
MIPDRPKAAHAENRSLFRGLFLVNFAITLGFGIADAFFSLYVFSLGARGMLLGLPLVFYSLSKIILSPFMGAWADRIGRRKVAAVSLGLYLFVSVSYLFTTSLTLITLLRLLQGIGCAMFRPMVVSLVSECTCDKRRATVMGTFDISFYGALSLGPLVGGILKDLWGFRGIFATLALLCITALAVAFISIPSHKDASSQPTHYETEHLWGLLNITRHSSLRGLLAFIFGRACGISLLGAFLPIMLTARLGLNGTRAGLVMASSTLVMTLLLRPMGMLSDRAPRKSLVVAGGTAVSLLYFLIPVAAGFSQILALAVGIGLFSVLSQPASTALLVEEGSRHGMGATVGTFNSVLNLGFVSGPLLGAGLQTTLGLTAVFYAAGVMGLGAVVLFMVNVFYEEGGQTWKQPMTVYVSMSKKLQWSERMDIEGQ